PPQWRSSRLPQRAEKCPSGPPPSHPRKDSSGEYHSARAKRSFRRSRQGFADNHLVTLFQPFDDRHIRIVAIANFNFTFTGFTVTQYFDFITIVAHRFAQRR